jgi:regulator of sigma E protease
MPSWLWFLTVIPALGFLVFVHELGHFLTALRLGIKAEEFGFGYPPRMMTLFRWKGVPVTLNWLPLGGFVRFVGEEGNFEAEGSLMGAPPWKKIPVLAAGAVMNIIAAIGIFAIVGMFEPIGPVVIQNVQENSPAQQAGLRDGDVILEVDGERISAASRLATLVRERAGQQITIDIQREDQDGVQRTMEVAVVPRTPEQLQPGQGPTGISPYVPTSEAEGYQMARNPLSALWYGVEQTFTFLMLMITGLGMLLGSLLGLVSTDIQGGVAGPVGIARITGEVARTGGLLSYLNWTAIISVNLALINLLPIPALDGSRIVFALIEWIRRGKKVPPEKEAMVHAIGMVALLGLMLLITFSDVRNIVLGRSPFGG